MKLINEIESLQTEFTCWSGAQYNYNLICKSNRDCDFIANLEEIYPEGLTDTELNDILWFDDEFCYQFINDEFLNDEELEIKRNYLR